MRRNVATPVTSLRCRPALHHPHEPSLVLNPETLHTHKLLDGTAFPLSPGFELTYRHTSSDNTNWGICAQLAFLSCKWIKSFCTIKLLNWFWPGGASLLLFSWKPKWTVEKKKWMWLAFLLAFLHWSHWNAIFALKSIGAFLRWNQLGHLCIDVNGWCFCIEANRTQDSIIGTFFFYISKTYFRPIHFSGQYIDASLVTATIFVRKDVPYFRRNCLVSCCVYRVGPGRSGKDSV